ncbi:MAG TPA: hypothetical protein VF092_22055 [Longimicrobium sp.]
MKKLRLRMDELCVESFPTAEGVGDRGTVNGAGRTFPGTGCHSCENPSACIETCPNTCDNSFDLCTCAC